MKGSGTDQVDRIRGEWLFVAALCLLALAVRALAGPRTIDDAYITFRYARNLAQGLGFVYNPGQQVLGTTTPLYTLTMALAYLTGLLDLPLVALTINALADAATVALLYALGRHFSGSRLLAAALGLAWALSPMSVTFAVGGMETSVVIFFLVASFAAYTAGHSRLSAAAMALAVLTRPDALIAALLLFADMALRPLLTQRHAPWPERLRRLPWTEAAIFLGLLAPWLLFATAYFGSPLPQSIQAKVRAYHLDQFSALIRFLQHYATPFFEHEVLGRFWPAVGLPLYLALYLVGGLRLLRRSGRALPMFLYPLLYAAVFAAANPLIFRWYLAPPLPFYFLGILVGLHGLLLGLARRLGGERLTAGAGLLVILLVLPLSLNAYTLHPDHGPDRPAPEMAWFKLELLYQQAAELVRPHLQPGDTIAAGDIGAVGWYSGAPILDTVGLISPEAASYYPLDPSALVITYAIAPDLIRDRQPEYLITLEVYVRKTLLPAAWFQEEYEILTKIETDIYGSDGMLVFHLTQPALP
jgi:hypothetical protein